MNKIKLDRKQKFLINSFILAVLMYALGFGIIPINSIALVLFLGYIVLSIFVVHYPNLSIKTVFISSILPLFLMSGAILILRYFPNITSVFKILMIIGFAGMYYITSLVDNIFLVVDERKEVIPLYRVAVTWSHIMIVVIAIPFFAGLFKVPLIAFWHNVIVFISSLIFCYYIIKASRHDKGMKDVGIGEGILISLYSAILVSGVSTAVSFIPTEAFIRALLVSSVLMFVLNYTISGYLKNEINKKIILEYLSLTLIFLLLTIILD